MENEQLFLLSAIVNLCVVLVAARLGPRWLVGTIVVNLLLITIFGAKLISVFGIVTNVGNVFYACVFFATHLLIEQQGRAKAVQTLWFGASFIVFFLVMAELAVSFVSYLPNDPLQGAMQTLFTISPRVAFASILAFLFAQYANIALYSWLAKKTQGKHLWLRSNGANIISQGIDSCLFFTIAFIDLPGMVLVQAIAAGWLLKSLVVALGTPLLYVDAFLRKTPA